MRPLDPKLSQLTDTQIVMLFRQALLALAPSLRELDILSDDKCPYDEYDEIAERLFDVMVAGTLMYKYGLDAPPRLPLYGTGNQKEADGCIVVIDPNTGGELQFIDFYGNRTLGTDFFNVVRAQTNDGSVVEVPVSAGVAFKWAR